MIRKLIAVPIALLALVALTACGGSGKSAPRLRWETPEGANLQVHTSDDSTKMHQTVVYIDNAGSALRDARLRLHNDFSAPVGLDVGGTITRLPTVIDGHDQVWELGDLGAGDRVQFPIGLWFDVSPQLQSTPDVEFRLELTSPDLPSAIQSSPLVVSLAPQQ